MQRLDRMEKVRQRISFFLLIFAPLTFILQASERACATVRPLIMDFVFSCPRLSRTFRWHLVLVSLLMGGINGLFGASMGEMPSRIQTEIEVVPSSPDPKMAHHGLPLARNIGLPAPDLSAIFLEDQSAEKVTQAKTARRLGIKRPLSEVKPAAAEWTLLGDGSRVWAGQFESAGALGIRLHFTSVTLPPGGVLIVYDPENPDQAEGPFDRAYLAGRDSFWSSTVFSGVVIVEAQVPAGSRLAEFSLKELTHNYRQLAVGEAKSAQSCELDFGCELAQWGTAGAAVSGVGVVSKSGAIFCTGCLLNDKDPAPLSNYYLTAAHCIRDQEEADSVELYWLYQTTSCEGLKPNMSTVPRTRGGGEILSRRAEGEQRHRNDHVFLQLRGAIPLGVTYAGWSTNSPAVNEIVTCIHHPSGDYKRISHGTIDSRYSTDNFWKVLWLPNRGVTEKGSSGGPLFNAKQQVIGHLCHGASDCNNSYPEDQFDVFGRFSITFEFVHYWLLNEKLPSVPVNDAFESPKILKGFSGTLSDNNLRGSRQMGEPSIDTIVGGTSLWYSWIAPAAGRATFDTLGSAVNTLLAVYTGTTLGAITLKAENDDWVFGEVLQSKVELTVVEGTQYSIAVDSYDASFDPARSPIILHWFLPEGPPGGEGNDSFSKPITLTGSRGQVRGANLNYSREIGEPSHQPVGFSAARIGRRSAWWSWTAPASQRVTFDTLGSDFDTVMAVYTGSDLVSLIPVIQNDDINLGTVQSRVTFDAEAGTVYWIAVDGFRSATPLQVDQREGTIVLNWSREAPLIIEGRWNGKLLVEISYASEVGRSYRLESTTDLGQVPVVWTALEEQIGNGTSMIFVDRSSNRLEVQRKYYRVVTF